MYILSALFWPAVIIGIIYLIRRGRRDGHPLVIKEDVTSQWFLLLSTFFFGVTLLAFNKDLGGLVSWRTILLVATAVGIAMAYKFRVVAILVFGLISMLVWWVAQSIFWIGPNSKINFMGVFSGGVLMMLVFYVLGYVHMGFAKLKKFAMAYRVLGLVLVTMVMFLMSAKTGLYLVESLSRNAAALGTWQVMSILIILLLSVLGLGFYTWLKKQMLFPEYLAVILLALVFGGMTLASNLNLLSGSWELMLGPGGDSLTGSGMIWAIGFNFGVFIELLGLIFIGYVRREGWLINLGAVFLSLLIVVKYFDWFFSFLDKSVFFIGAGIVMFGVGWFMEKGRKIMIAKIKTPQI